MADVTNSGKKLYGERKGGEDPIPPEFIAAMERYEEVQWNRDAVTTDATSDTIVESRIETDRTHERKKTNVGKVAGNITLNDISENEQGQPVQLVKTLYRTSSPPTDVPPSATVKVGVKDLGNGFSIRTVATEGTYSAGSVTPALFPGTMNEVRQAIVLPDKFKQSGATLTITAATSAGTAATTTALGTEGTGIVDSKAQRVDPFTVRLEDTTLTVLVNISVQEYGFYEGLVAPITTTYIADAAAAPPGGLLVTNVQREVIGGGKAINKVEAVAAWPTRYGQDYDPRLNIIRRWTESTVAPNTGTGTAGMEIHPLDYARQLNRQYDTSAITTELAAVNIKIAGKTRVDLPDVLTGLTMTYNKTLGSGSSSHPTANQQFVITGAGSASTRISGQAQASAAITPELIPAITRYGGKLVPCTHCFFYMALPVTTAQVLTRLATASLMNAAVTDLPVFKEKIHTFVLKGQQVSIRQAADTDTAISFNEDASHTTASVQWGNEKSGEVGISSRVVTIGPVINAAITIGSASDTQAVTITVTADAGAITGAVPISAITNSPTAASATATGEITPTTAAATSPTSVPTTGLYLVELNPSLGEFGYAFIHAVVVDFSVYA